jgi:hypothetical protein
VRAQGESCLQAASRAGRLAECSLLPGCCLQMLEDDTKRFDEFLKQNDAMVRSSWQQQRAWLQPHAALLHRCPTWAGQPSQRR